MSATPSRIDNPLLTASSRVPAWAALMVATLLIAVRVAFFDLFDVDVRARSILTPFGAAWWFCVALVVLAAVPRRIEVGAEGLRIGWLLPPRLVRYEDIVRAAPVGEHDVVLELAGGDTVRIHRSILGGDKPHIVLSRLWQALAAGPSGRLEGHERDLLARGGRSAEDWAEGLRSLGDRGRGYRGPLDEERLWAIVENPTVIGELRLAAAVACAPWLDETRRARLRAIAESTVDEQLRAGLEKLANESLDSQRALEAFQAADIS